MNKATLLGALSGSLIILAAHAGQAAGNDAKQGKTARPPLTTQLAPSDDPAIGKPPLGTKDESTADYFRDQADHFYHIGDYPRAVELDKAVVALEPDDYETYGVGAWLLWSLGKNDDAIAFIQRGLDANPTAPGMWETAGGQYDFMKRFADSENAYTHAIEYAPKDTPSDAMNYLRRRLAHSQEGNGHWDAAIKTWADLVHDFPNDPVDVNNYARAQRRVLPGK